MSTTPTVSVALGSYNRRAFLKLTIDSIRSEVSGIPHEIIVVDGGSNDGSLRWLTRQKDIITIVQHNRGTWRGRQIERRSWGYFMNLAFKAAQGEYVCMVSDDCLLVPGAIQNGIRSLKQFEHTDRRIGAVAFYWRDWPQDNKYRVGLTLGGKMFVNHGLYLRDALEDVGYCDENRYVFYHADGDLCLKLWNAGFEVVAADDSYVEHYCDVSPAVRRSNAERRQTDWDKYIERWTGVFYDPGRPNIGGWITKAYDDVRLTADRFRRLHKSCAWKSRLQQQLSSWLFGPKVFCTSRKL